MALDRSRAAARAAAAAATRDEMGKKERAREAKAGKRERRSTEAASMQLNWQIGMGVTGGVIAMCVLQLQLRPGLLPARSASSP
jgi:hypothetical protein